MSFLTPLMLVGVLAAGIPIAIHLFFRSRYRTVPWAAMKFLLTSVEQTSRRLKFQEYALLLLRMILLTLLAVAFMRPLNLTLLSAGWISAAAVLFCITLSWWLAVWGGPSFARNGIKLIASYAFIAFLWLFLAVAYPFISASAVHVVRGKGDAVDAVFVFDLSYSMSANDGDGKTRLKRAQEEAVKIIDELPAHSTVQIVTCSGKDKADLGPHLPGNLDQARNIIDGLDITHQGTDLYQGVAKAEGILLKRGQASNKELYLFSDMQKMGFDQHAGELKKTLQAIKEKASVHLVRCGTRPVKNIAVIDIKPQSGVPRPGERVGFAVLVRNSGAEAIENVKVSLTVDGNEKATEETNIAKVKANEIYAVTLTAKLTAPGLRVLTAKVSADDLEADNRFDQVVLVRDRVNILVVDGNYSESNPDKSSSYFLMHALLPVKETERATYKYNPRVVPARLASAAQLGNQDVCILVNCSVQPKLGLRADSLLSEEFLTALEAFVRKGHGLIVFAGDNVQPDAYNKILGKKYGLLPLPLKAAIKSPLKEFKINRDSFGSGPPSYWIFKDDKLYEKFNEVPVWQHLDVDEMGWPKVAVKKDEDPPPVDRAKNAPEVKETQHVDVIVRLDSGKPLAISRKLDAGEVTFILTAAQHEGFFPDTNTPSWTMFNFLPHYVYFLNATLAHLMHGQTQTYNLVAGETLHWYPSDKIDHVYSLVHPDLKTVERLKPPERIDKRLVVTKSDLSHAGVYRMISHPRGFDGSETIDLAASLKNSVPIAVIPDLEESKDLTSLTDKQLDEQLGFTPVHITAGGGPAASLGADRFNREWTVWALLAVLVLVVFEVAFAWWCGRAW